MRLINDILDRFRFGSAGLSLYNVFKPVSKTFQYTEIDDGNAIKYGYMSNLEYYSVVKKAATGVQSLPFVLERKTSEGWEEVERTAATEDLYEFVFYPNQDQSLGELFEQATIFRLCNGESFFYNPSESVGFMGERVVCVPPELVTVITSDKTSILSPVEGYIIQDGGKKITVRPEEMLHVRMTNPSVEGMQGRNGLSPLQAGQHKLKGSNTNAEAQAEYFENRGVSNIISGESTGGGLSLKPSDKKLLDEANSERFGGGGKFNRVITLKSPVTVQQLGSSPSDLQMIERDKQYLRDLCNLIFMPSELFNDPENKTHANRKEAVKTLYHDVLIPTGNVFAHGYNRTFLREWGNRRGQDFRLRVDIDAIEALMPSPMEKRREIREDVKSGLISPNEGRIENGLVPMDLPEMDIPRVQTSTQPVTQGE
jgi:HK97 family phage portal protein